MKKQFYYSEYANKDQVYCQETDPELYELLSHLQVSKVNKLLDHVSKSFMSLEGNKKRLFYSFKYNDYTNLSKLEAGRRIYIHGLKGIHDLKRAAKYSSCFVCEESTLSGKSFFDYVFGTEYPTEYELRTKERDEVKRILQASAESPDGQQSSIYINNKDRKLVCRIAERLWSAQLQDSTCRLVILLPTEEIYDESVDLLKQLYLLLPQRLRLNMGFAVDCSLNDIKELTETCDLPIHIFTMRAETKAELEEKNTDIKLKYPLVYFDATNLEKEPFDGDRLSLLEKLSNKLTSSDDAKMTYIEKTVLDNGKRLVSFKNLQEIYDLLKKEDYFWWNRQDMETLESLMTAYYDQYDMMKDEELKKEALQKFFMDMLPEKEYAVLLTDVVLNQNYPNRKEIYAFFEDELCFGKILKAMELVQKKVWEEADRVKTAELSAMVRQHQGEMQAMTEQKDAELTQKQKALDDANQKNKELQAEMQNKIRIYAEEKKTMQETHLKEMTEVRAQGEEAVKNAKEAARAKYDEMQRQLTRLQMDKTALEQENSSIRTEQEKLITENRSISESLRVLRRGGVDLEVERLKEEVEEKEGTINKLSKDKKLSASREKKAKTLMVIAAVAAGVFLIGTIVLGVLQIKKGNEVKELEKQVETINTQMQEKDTQLGELQVQLDAKETELQELKDTMEEDTEGVSEDMQGAPNTEGVDNDSESSEGLESSETNPTDGTQENTTNTTEGQATATSETSGTESGTAENGTATE